MTTFIDAAGLTDAPVPVQIYAKALGIEGYLVPGEERDVLLRTLVVAPPAQGDVTIITGPGAARYWALAPRVCRVVIVPGEQEIPSAQRAETPLEWALRWVEGCSQSEAKALVAKSPTSKHGLFGAFVRALGLAQAFEQLLARPGLVEGEGLHWLGQSEPDRSGPPYEFVLVDNLGAFRRLADELRRAVDSATDDASTSEVIGLDVESDLEEDFNAKLVGVGLSFTARERPGNADGDGREHSARDAERGRGTPRSYYLPLNGPLGEDTALALIQSYFGTERPSTSPCPWFIAHNSKYDMQVLASALWPDSPVLGLRRLATRLAGDGLIAAYCLARVYTSGPQTGYPLPRDLKGMAERLFGVHMLHFKDMLALSGASRSSEAPLGDIGPYCAADAFWGLRVQQHQVGELERFPRLKDLYALIELPSVIVTAEMEMLGLRIDYELLRKRREEVTKRVEVYRLYLEKQAVRAGYVLAVARKMCPLHSRKKVDYETCPSCDERGRYEATLPFNPGSGPQVEAVVQGTFRLPRMASTDGGAASNDEGALLRIREGAEGEDAKDWITFLLAWRKEDKIRGTYLEGLWERKRRNEWQDSAGSWYVHSTFNQAVVPSGRYSSKNPNGQNYPPKLRDVFIA